MKWKPDWYKKQRLYVAVFLWVATGLCIHVCSVAVGTTSTDTASINACCSRWWCSGGWTLRARRLPQRSHSCSIISGGTSGLKHFGTNTRLGITGCLSSAFYAISTVDPISWFTIITRAVTYNPAAGTGIICICFVTAISNKHAFFLSMYIQHYRRYNFWF